MRRSLLLFLLFTIVLCGCARISGSLPPPGPPVPTQEFCVGAARVDITPMPGYPMGGMAAGGKISRGVWTRLNARAFVLEDRAGNGVALVSCDLWSIPGGLADRVAELVANEYGVPRLGREQIVLAATHTHHSPGNYSSSFIYNEAASLKPGFDRDLFDFLAHRIARVIGEAWKRREPAVLIRSEKPVIGVARNRSLETFLANGDAAREWIEENADLPIVVTPFPVGSEDAYRALDPTMTVIRAESPFRDCSEPPLAVLAFYAVHPTGMGPVSEVYNSDLFGIAASNVERRLGDTVVGFFNGAEGDMAPNWERQDRPATLKLAGMLEQGIEELIRQPGRDVTGSIRYSFGTTSFDDVAKPASGASQLPGSEGDWTFFRSAGWREGLREEREEERIEGHGPKKEALASEIVGIEMPFKLSAIPGLSRLFPREFDLGVYRVGSVTFATLPGEFTTMLGRRIAESVAEAAQAEDRVLLVAPANEYLSYFTTKEEFRLQHYEGASTLWGPESAVKIENVLVELAGALDAPRQRTEKEKYRYSAGPAAHFGVKEFAFPKHAERLKDTFYSLAPVLMNGETGFPVPNHPYMVWIEENPRWKPRFGGMERLTPSVRVEQRVDGAWSPLMIDGIPETDAGVDFVTTVVTSYVGKSRWMTIWMTPEGVDEGAELRLVAEGTSGATFRSRAFTLPEAHDNWGFLGIARPEQASIASR